MLVLRETSPEVAHRLAERIRTQVMSLEFPAPAFRVTVSLGIAHTRYRHTGFNDLVRLADEALYAAKRNGRNRVELRMHPAPVL